MQIKAPRLYLNRCGVYYFRIKSGGTEKRISLRTKCSNTANILALQLNLELERKRAMSDPRLSDFDFDLESIRRYELDLKNGVAKARGAADHARMMEAIERLGPIDPEDRPLRSATAPPASAPSPTRVERKLLPLSKAADIWLAERAKKNAPRTVDAKRFHIHDFMRHVGAEVDVNALDKPAVVGYKAARLGAGQTGKTVDNKLMTLHDFFKYLLANAHYTIGGSNPVDGLFVLTKRERVKKNEPYQPFTKNEIERFFEPSVYVETMDFPDLFWSPLIAVYTGMRISEATAIRCDDIREANGVYYIHVPKSKTTAGIRNVPICDALLKLGFLDYVEQAKLAGADRIYPHRLEINHSYSKELSKKMLAHQKAIGIKRPNDHKSFHSFRVNVITAMANNGANIQQTTKIVGHKGDGDEVHMGYVRDLPDLKAVVDGLAWPISPGPLAYDGRFGPFLRDRNNWAVAKPKKEKVFRQEGARRATSRKFSSDESV